MESNQTRISPAQALWLLSSVCTILKRSIDDALVAQECSSPLSVDTFLKLGEKAGLAATSQVSLLDEDCVPSVFRLRAASTPREQAITEDDTSWVIALEVTNSQVTVLAFGAKAPERLDKEQILSRIVGPILSFTAAEAPLQDPDAIAGNRQTFGFSWFVPELLKHRSIWRDVLLASLCIQLMALAFPLFTQAIIDKVVVHRTQSTLTALAVGMAVFMVFTACLSWLRQYFVLHTGNRVDAVLGSHVFEHLLRLPLPYFHQRPTGVISARLAGIESIREFVSGAAVTLVLDLPFVCIFLAAMFFYSVTLTLIVCAILSVIVIASLIAAPIFQRRLNEQFLRGAANQAFLTEYIASMETVKSLQLEPQLSARYRDQLAAYLSASFRSKQLGNTYGTFANTLEQMMNLLILSIGAYLVMSSSKLTVGMLIAFQMFSSRVSQPVLRMVGLWQQFQQARLSVQRLGDLMDAPSEHYKLERTHAARGVCSVSIDGLSFRYAQDRAFLYQNFNLRVGAGELVVVMGASGSGKSTLSKLLQGFYQPESGAIRLDTVDIRNLSANELRSNFGVVPQETVLFAGTILDNLKLANPYATFEQIVAAARMAEIHAVIESLPNGYMTEIGERGVGLSGGQRQRVAIARALLKGPRILIFDEATSSLDAATGEQLARTVNALKGKVTILFITHAMPKTLQPDRIARIGEKLAVVSHEHKEPAVQA